MKPLNWALLTPYSIHNETDSTHKGTAWFSGRVMDVLLNGKVFIIATNYGGVWTVDSSKTVLEGFDTRCLTDDWDDPNVHCLAHGPDNDNQIYAGCEKTVRYFELNNDNLIAASVVLNPVSNLNTVYRILIQKESQRIILATGAGLWWSAIPPNRSDATAYSWTKAGGLPGDVISGLCHASNNAIHAGVYGDGKAAGNNYGIFKGVFQNTSLNFTRSKIKWHDGRDKHDMRRVSLASCANNRAVAFASVSDSEERPKPDFRGVLKYNEADDQWEDILNQKNFDDDGEADPPGAQGWFNNVIEVAPDDPNLVAFGWQHGTFIFNPDRVFKPQGNKLNITRLHKHKDERIRGDVHSLNFTKLDNGEHKLYIGGDGGLLKVTGPRRTPPALDDRLNVFLPTLLFKDELRAKQYATIDTSPVIDGLIAGGLQDNGCKFLKTAKGKYTSWQQLLSGDGGTNTFLANGILLNRASNKGNKFKSHRWVADKNSFDGGSDIPLPVAVELDPKQEVCTRIPLPAFRNKDHLLMHAISAAVQSKDGGFTKAGDNLLLGLFENGEGSTQFHWEIVGVRGSLIKAAASADGNSIFVSTEDGKVSLLTWQKLLDGQKPVFTDLPIPAQLGTGSVVQFEITKATVFALFEEFAGGVARRGHILVLDGSQWKEIPTTPVIDVIYSITADWDINPNPLAPEDKRLFFTTDNAVYQGVQSAGQPITSFDWEKSTDGLPARPHCTHLRLGWDDKKLFLYLSTYGRSVYRTELRELVQLPGH